MNHALKLNGLNRASSQGPRRSEISLKILDILKQHDACDMEDLMSVCPSFTWNQVFLEVDHLSRTGELRLVPKRAGVYAVTLPVAAIGEGAHARA